MKLTPKTSWIAVLSACLLGFAGCGEDNEAASRDQAAKSTGLINPSNALPQAKTQAEFYKTNPGSSPGATGSGSKAGGKSTSAAPAPKKQG